MNEVLLYLGLTFGTLAGGRLAGVPFDPDGTFRFTGAACQQDHVALPTVLTVRSCDKLAHAAGGALVVGASVALDHRTNREPCLRTVLRGALRAQLASALYEVGTALTHRRQWGQPGFGIGLGDHLAVTLGSAVAGGLICGAKALLR